jgi:hypothetical protein
MFGTERSLDLTSIRIQTIITGMYPDPAKSFESLNIRIHNTDSKEADGKIPKWTGGTVLRPAYLMGPIEL